MAAGIPITTKANVKALLGYDGTDKDANIDAMIAAVSDFAETEMGRLIESKSRTIEKPVEAYVSLFRLDGWPVAGVTLVQWAPDDMFDADEIETVAASDYILRKPIGKIRWKPASAPYARGGFVRITYTGGMATDQADFQAKYPDIELAAREEVVNRLNRAANPDGSSKLLDSGMVYDKQMSQLADFRRALAARKSLHVA